MLRLFTVSKGRSTMDHKPDLILSVGFGEIYKNYGIDSEQGAILVIRPDGCEFRHVASKLDTHIENRHCDGNKHRSGASRSRSIFCTVHAAT